jgi:hypothetical protein
MGSVHSLVMAAAGKIKAAAPPAVVVRVGGATGFDLSRLQIA